MLEDTAFRAEGAGADIRDLVKDDAADLGTDDVFVARLSGQRLAHADFRQAGAVEGGIVEIADAVFPGGLHRAERFRLGNVTEPVAERRRAEAALARRNILDRHGLGLPSGDGEAIGRTQVGPTIT